MAQSNVCCIYRNVAVIRADVVIAAKDTTSFRLKYLTDALKHI
jgi:hypothetical protein